MSIDLDKLFELIDESAVSQDKVLAGKMWVALAESCGDQLDRVQIDAVAAARAYWHNQSRDDDRRVYLQYISLKLDRLLRDGQNETLEAKINRIVFASLLGNEGMSPDNLDLFLDLAEDVRVKEPEIMSLVFRFIPQAERAIEE